MFLKRLVWRGRIYLLVHENIPHHRMVVNAQNKIRVERYPRILPSVLNYLPASIDKRRQVNRVKRKLPVYKLQNFPTTTPTINHIRNTFYPIMVTQTWFEHPRFLYSNIPLYFFRPTSNSPLRQLFFFDSSANVIPPNIMSLSNVTHVSTKGYKINCSLKMLRRCPWCNGYRRRKWARRHEFKSWTRLITDWECPAEDCGPQRPPFEQPQPRCRRSEFLKITQHAIVKRRSWANIAVCPCLHPSLTHHRNINPFENKVWEIYLYKEVCSFVHWSS